MSSSGGKQVQTVGFSIFSSSRFDGLHVILFLPVNYRQTALGRDSNSAKAVPPRPATPGAVGRKVFHDHYPRLARDVIITSVNFIGLIYINQGIDFMQ